MEGQVECPVCQRSFRKSQIDVHVNECLNNTTTQETTYDSPKIAKKRKSNDTFAWGCLKPVGGKSNTSPVHKKQKLTTATDSFRSHQETGRVEDKSNDHESNDTDTDHECLQLGSKINKHYRNNKPNVLSTDSSSSTVSIVCPSGTETASFPSVSNKSGPQECGRNDSCAVSIGLTASSKPLAEQMRPKSLEEYVGQDKAVGRNSLLRSLLQSDQIPSLILWGPPGCGKTTLAKIIAQQCKEGGTLKFVQLSATTSGVNDVKQVVKVAKNDQRMLKKKTILFLDEIHRFNKTQQDSLLPHVEDGTIILIGATTENPSFQVNNALLSRCRVITLDKLEPSDLQQILVKAVMAVGGVIVAEGCGPDEGDETKSDRRKCVYVEQQALTTLSNLCDGDARAALNSLHMALQSRLCQHNSQSQDSTSSQSGRRPVVTSADVKEGLQRSHVLYDRAGEEHYNIVSALHKSIRASDATAALYWLARMLEGGENPLYVARRLIRVASEDVGLADPTALTQAVSAYQACHLIGMPECDVMLAQCTVYLCRAPKSVEIYKAYNKAKTQVKGQEGTQPSVPLHLRNASTKLMKSLGYGKGYKYNPDYDEPVDQDYLPPQLKHINFFT
ncbi:ATPase WRNIP1-like [Mizuhopecten yessoensis]|nr:ATPase WRNIP1-like [Mizuhopecten yessoensis]